MYYICIIYVQYLSNTYIEYAHIHIHIHMHIHIHIYIYINNYATYTS